MFLERVALLWSIVNYDTVVRDVLPPFNKNIHCVDKEDGVGSPDNVQDPLGNSFMFFTLGLFVEVPVLWTFH